MEGESLESDAGEPFCAKQAAPMDGHVGSLIAELK
jgi:hypothetical protein